MREDKLHNSSKAARVYNEHNYSLLVVRIDLVFRTDLHVVSPAHFENGPALYYLWYDGDETDLTGSGAQGARMCVCSDTSLERACFLQQHFARDDSFRHSAALTAML